MSKWLLPDYVNDVLPSEARKIEEMRRVILDKFRIFGYELVMPPLIEYLDSLLIGTGKDLDTQTFKILDLQTSKTMGIRADITPQIARIDAHLLNRQNVSRLCYVGEVLHIKPKDEQETRTPFQIGAEIYGESSIKADIEILELMQESLCVSDVKDFYVSIGHAKFIDILNIDPQSELFNAILIKNISYIQKCEHKYKEIILELMQVFSIADKDKFLKFISLKDNYPLLSNVINDVVTICEYILKYSNKYTNIDNYLIDILDLEGYCYHNGLTYNIYHKKSHNPIAKGGRYDNVSASFGRARPATGFSINLRQISNISNLKPHSYAILAPWSADDNLKTLINVLREQGKIVIQLNDDINIDEFEFTQKILLDKDNKWVIENL